MDREVLVRLRLDISQYQRDAKIAAADTIALGRATNDLGSSGGPLQRAESQAKRTGSEIDKLSGRLRVMTDLVTIGAPALTAFGAGAVGGLVALSAQLGATVGAIGVTVLAVNGLGDGLKALDEYQLHPTTENLTKLNEAMAKLGPSGEQFVKFLDQIEPDLKGLQMLARDGLLPGAEEGIDALLRRLPELRSLIKDTATEVGDLMAGGGKAVAGGRFDAFFNYLRTDGIPILDDTAKTAGNLAEVVANLFVAFGGTETSFSGGLLKFSQGLAKASADLSSNDGFQEFLRYVETEGPHALETLGSIANAVLQVVEATAPLGGPVLTILGKFADIIAAIADSDIGSPLFAGLAALALFNRAMALTQSLSQATWGGPGVGLMRGYVSRLNTVVTAQDRATMSAKELAAAEAQQSRNMAGLAKAGQVGAIIAGLALANTDLAQSTGLSNTANLALAGSLGGPLATGAGAAVGSVLDLKATYDSLNDTLANLDTASAGTDITALTNQIAAAKAQLDGMEAGPSLTRRFAEGIGSGFGIGGIMKTQDELNSSKVDDFKNSISEAEKRLADLKSGAIETFNPVAQLGMALQTTAQDALDQAKALQDATDAMQEHRSEAIRSVNAALNYQAAIDDASDALKKNGKTVDATTEAGRDNLSNLYALADAWNGQSNAAKNAKGSLEAARHNFIDTAEQMGMAADKAHLLANRLFEIPPKRKTQIELDGADDAIDKVKTLAQYIAHLHGKSIDIALNYQRHDTKPGAPLPGAQPSADGGTVPKTGRGYADRHLYLLADGEEVVSNRHGQADRHRSLLKAINSGRKMADGGTAGRGRSGTLLLSPFGADIVQNAHGVGQALRELQAALDKSEKSLDKERQTRDDLQSQFDSIKSQVGGAYSQLDPFAMTQTSPWAAGSGNALASFDAAVSGNTATTQAAQAALAFAKAKGLDGPLYAALAASGNLPLLQQFAQLSAAQIDQREQAFAAQSNAQSALGGMVAQTEVGSQLAGANQRLDAVVKEVKELRHDVKNADKNNQWAQDKNAKDVTKGVNGAASSGHKRGRG